MNDALVQVLIALLPSVVVFLTAYHLIKQFMEARTKERMADMKQDDRRQTIPLRLQAYERFALFLERITPGALVLRVHKSNMTSRMLHGELVATVREEFEHNVTQQVYIGDKAWSKIRQAKEETIRLINLSYEQTGDVQQGTELSRRIFDNVSKLSHTPSQEAMVAIKEEVRRLF